MAEEKGWKMFVMRLFSTSSLKQKLSKLLYLIYLLVFVSLIFEGLYRMQIIDFYKNELIGLNPKTLFEKNNKPNVLAFGDSFIGQPQSFVEFLQDSFPNYHFVNNGIPGTGIFEARSIANNRMKEFPPKRLIYQIYVGNDLMNIRKNTNWNKLPFLKNVYYSLANYFKSLEFLNYRFAQFAYFRKFKTGVGMKGADENVKEEDVFEVEKYSPYEKQVLSGDPQLLENSILLKEDRIADFAYLQENIQRLIKAANNDSIPVYLVVIPHCSQVNAYYRQKYEDLGIKMPQDSLYTSTNYPFIQSLRKAFSQQKNILIVDLLPALQAKDSLNRRMYFENDFHFTEAGQRVAADVLAKYFR